jgi:hypothetical protein
VEFTIGPNVPTPAEHDDVEPGSWANRRFT